jgi:hypothetical protein
MMLSKTDNHKQYRCSDPLAITVKRVVVLKYLHELKLTA